MDKVGMKPEATDGRSLHVTPLQEPSTEELSMIARVARQPGFRLSTILLITAAAVLVVSIFLPYWRMRLNAPQYPGGLFVTVYVNHMEGDIREIDGLNHYIGMAPLEEAAQLERTLAPIALAVMVLMIMGVAFIHSQWFAIFAIPTMTFPVVFLADMWVWLWYYGNNLDPTAALSSSIKPFTPMILGTGHVGQFSTTAWLMPGWYLAALAAILTGVGLHYRRKARKVAESAGN
jgi:copper chaperone NosL